MSTDMVVLDQSVSPAKAITLLHSEWPKLYGVLVVLSTIGLKPAVCAFTFHRIQICCVQTAKVVIGLHSCIV